METAKEIMSQFKMAIEGDPQIVQRKSLTVWIVGAGVGCVFVVGSARRRADSSATSSTSVAHQRQP